MMASQNLSVLIMEDSGSDIDLLIRVITKAGYIPVYRQIEKAEQLQKALEEGGCDIVIADYSLPGFSAEAVLDMLREIAPDIPCIILSGQVGEEVAIKMLESGAKDFITKNHIERIGLAIRRVIYESSLRREIRAVRKALVDVITLFDDLPVSAKNTMNLIKEIQAIIQRIQSIIAGHELREHIRKAKDE